MVRPASTEPDVGAPEVLDLQLVRLPVKLYEKLWALLLSPGEMFAVPSNWQPPSDCAPADGTTAKSAAKIDTSPAKTSLRKSLSSKGSEFHPYRAPGNPGSLAKRRRPPKSPLKRADGLSGTRILRPGARLPGCQQPYAGSF